MDALALAAHILIPFILSALLAIPKKGRFSLSCLVELNASNGLFDQPLFRFVVLVPIFLFISFGLIAWKGYSIDLSAEGLNKFIQISKLPLGLLSLIVPIGAIVASFHTTHQTAAQISIADQKGKLELFYQHREEFFNYFDRVGERTYHKAFTAKFKAQPSVHKRFFSGEPEKGTPIVRLRALHQIQESLNISGAHIKSVIEGLHYNPRCDAYMEACTTLNDVALQLGLPEIYQDMDGVRLKSGDIEFKSLGNNVTTLLASLRYCTDFLNALCDFCGEDIGLRRAPMGYLLNGVPPNIQQCNMNIMGAINTLRNAEFDKTIR
ncbi:MULTISPECIES: hypothetical protein [Gammaproteobacteria]|uniref:hypothetical protein n=1 Tax=Gammaproteobacteria TaxID=1236 RepID=UPI001B835A4C|nr:hypothetical protein [Pseudomonas juntendi]MBR7523766.1 hypothetical protein [Pseudomonas juntendi]